MKKNAFLEVVFEKLHAKLKKSSYYNTNALSGKWQEINRWCTKFNTIYNKLYSEKENNSTNFDFLNPYRRNINWRRAMFSILRNYGRL